MSQSKKAEFAYYAAFYTLVLAAVALAFYSVRVPIMDGKVFLDEPWCYKISIIHLYRYTSIAIIPFFTPILITIIFAAVQDSPTRNLVLLTLLCITLVCYAEGINSACNLLEQEGCKVTIYNNIIIYPCAVIIPTTLAALIDSPSGQKDALHRSGYKCIVKRKSSC